MEDDMDPVMVKYFNDPIIVDEWSGETNSYPILIIGTQSMGGYIDKGKWGGGWQPAEGDDIETKSNELKDVFNKKLASMDIEPISSLNGNVAVCNVFDFDKDPVNIPLNINPGDYKCDQPFGDTTSGEETPDVILSKIINNSKWIYDKLIKGKHVFIHCNAGASRSPTVVVKMLIDTLGVSIDQAIEIVKRGAPKMHGNDRVGIGNFKDLSLEGAGAGAARAGAARAGAARAGAARAGAAQQEVSEEEQIRTIQGKIKEKESTIDLLENEGIDVSSIKAELASLETILSLLSEHAGGGKKRKSKKRKSKKRKSKKRKYKKRKSKKKIILFK